MHRRHAAAPRTNHTTAQGSRRAAEEICSTRGMEAILVSGARSLVRTAARLALHPRRASPPHHVAGQQISTASVDVALSSAPRSTPAGASGVRQSKWARGAAHAHQPVRAVPRPVIP
ncbi:hypothetical protein SEVIR_7G094150v4 [Setaria viridis]